ncbi:DUF4190 domain-containing protein [Oerskovia sp. M15]
MGPAGIAGFPVRCGRCAAGPYGGGDPGYGAPATDPGKTLGIVGLVLSILGCTSLIGLILSIVAFVKSRKAGFKNGIALAGIIVGAILVVASIVGGIIFAVAGGALVNDLLEACENIPSGDTVVWQGEVVTCPDLTAHRGPRPVVGRGPRPSGRSPRRSSVRDTWTAPLARLTTTRDLEDPVTLPEPTVHNPGKTLGIVGLVLSIPWPRWAWCSASWAW